MKKLRKSGIKKIPEKLTMLCHPDKVSKETPK
jgi:hypothetical protein